MEIKTLSSFPGVPFNDTFETFFETYEIGSDVECYQLFFCPFGKASNFDDLNQLDFKSEIVILNIMDSLIDEYDQLRLDRLAEFCQRHPKNKFIIFNFHFNLKSAISLPNLYLDTLWAVNFNEKLIHCEKKNITNNWLSLNSGTKLHRVLTVSYLLSKSYQRNGMISFNMKEPTLVGYDKYKNITPMPVGFKRDFERGFSEFKSKNFNLLNIPSYNRDTHPLASNYNENLLPVYENVAVEIITGTMFFESVPFLGEKEIQSVYAKNFPIYINGVGMAKEMKKFFDIDIFEDIVNHSYDDIENHFERLTTAINLNQHLLDGSTNIRELWYDNRKRFEDNCEKMDTLFYDKNFQKNANHSKIEKALSHFGVSVI